MCYGNKVRLIFCLSSCLDLTGAERHAENVLHFSKWELRDDETGEDCCNHSAHAGHVSGGA